MTSPEDSKSHQWKTPPEEEEFLMKMYFHTVTFQVGQPELRKLGQHFVM